MVEVWYFFLAVALYLFTFAKQISPRHDHAVRLVALLFWLTALVLIYLTQTDPIKSIAEAWFVVSVFLWLGYFVWYIVAVWLPRLFDFLRGVL